MNVCGGNFFDCGFEVVLMEVGIENDCCAVKMAL